MFYFCSLERMKMIRPDDDEIAMMIEIAVQTAPNYAIRGVFSGRKFDRSIAVSILVQRVFASLRRYELTRPAHDHELSSHILPLFPEAGPSRRPD